MQPGRRAGGKAGRSRAERSGAERSGMQSEWNAHQCHVSAELHMTKVDVSGRREICTRVTYVVVKIVHVRESAMKQCKMLDFVEGTSSTDLPHGATLSLNGSVSSYPLQSCHNCSRQGSVF